MITVLQAIESGVPFLQGFGPLAIAAIAGLGAGYLSDRKRAAAQRQAERENNRRLALERQAEQRYQMANDAARAQAEAATAEARRQALAGKEESFSVLRDAGEEEREARERLSKSLEKFSKESKKAKLSAAQKKRKGAVKRGVKGANVKGTGGGAGRSGIQGAISSAIGQGLSSAAETGGMAGELTAYGTDLAREMGIYGDLAMQARASGTIADGYRRTAALRDQLAGQDLSAMLSGISAQEQGQLQQNRWLAPQLALDPDYRKTISPDTGVSDLVGTGSKAFMTYYGLNGGF